MITTVDLPFFIVIILHTHTHKSFVFYYYYYYYYYLELLGKIMLLGNKSATGVAGSNIIAFSSSV